MPDTLHADSDFLSLILRDVRAWRTDNAALRVEIAPLRALLDN